MATCAIVTCPANELMATIHDRIPVIMPAAAREEWLDPTAEASSRHFDGLVCDAISMPMARSTLEKTALREY